MKALRWFTALAVMICATAAQAQGVPLQATPWTAGHVPQYLGGGYSQSVLGDAGPAAGGGIGTNPFEFGLTEQSPTNTYPAANVGTGPFYTNFCDYDAPKTNATGYHFLCLGPNASGGGMFAYGAAGAATPLPLYFNINGSTYQVPFTLSGGAAGPVSTTVGHAAYWNNTLGTLLGDSGMLTFGASWANAAGQFTTTFGTPTIASGACGALSNGVITSGVNQSGLVTIGAAATTACLISFSTTLASAPNSCIITPANAAAAAQGTTGAYVSAVSTTTWTITGTALANAAYRYQCW